MSSTDHIRIVLVRTFHPGNIGSVARAMKTMGLGNLHLVAPKQYPDEQADQMAAGATDVLSNAHVHENLAEAVADCRVVMACTARDRSYDLPYLDTEEAAKLLRAQAPDSPCALVFGPERMGLHNQDLLLARYRVTIPANPAYPSLNLAAAVQIASYEILKAFNTEPPTQLSTRAEKLLPRTDDYERLVDHVETVLRTTGFLRPHQGETMDRLRHLINRVEPSESEINILRGILRSIERMGTKE